MIQCYARFYSMLCMSMQYCVWRKQNNYKHFLYGVSINIKLWCKTWLHAKLSTLWYIIIQLSIKISQLLSILLLLHASSSFSDLSYKQRSKLLLPLIIIMHFIRNKWLCLCILQCYFQMQWVLWCCHILVHIHTPSFMKNAEKSTKDQPGSF